MKRRLIIGMSVFLVMVLVAGVAIAANPIKIFVNGQEIYSDVAPFIKDGRTMVPLRVISESLGADVEWDSFTNSVYISTPVTAGPAPTIEPTPPAYELILMSGDEKWADKVYLGKLTTDKYDSDSVFNEYGTYGSKYSVDSIWNTYGDYGSKYSSKSAFNEYATKPPEIYTATDSKTVFVGYLTKNKYLSTSYVDPDNLYAFLDEAGF